MFRLGDPTEVSALFEMAQENVESTLSGKVSGPDSQFVSDKKPSAQFLALIVAGNVTDVETVLVIGRGLRRRQQRHGGLRPRFAETGITDARKR